MSTTTIYHNPRCSKSRASLALLEQQNTDITVVKYLDTPLNAQAITELLAELGLGVREILRTTESAYQDQGFDDASLNDNELIEKLTKHPKVMERPIVSHRGQAVIGRPPENVLRLFS